MGLLRDGFERGEQVGVRRVVGGVTVAMGVAHGSRGVHNENAGHLERVAFGHPDEMAVQGVLKTPRVQMRRHQQFARAVAGQTIGRIRAFFGVAQAQKGDAGGAVGTKVGGIIGIAYGDQGDAGVMLLKEGVVAAQLRHMLTAERSTEMAQKHQHGRAVAPEFGKRKILAVRGAGDDHIRGRFSCKRVRLRFVQGLHILVQIPFGSRFMAHIRALSVRA